MLQKVELTRKYYLSESKVKQLWRDLKGGKMENLICNMKNNFMLGCSGSGRT